MSEDKMVTHPNHYQSSSGLEVIKVIEDFTENLTGMEAYCAGNIIKYACRWKKKNGVQDIKKCRQYCDILLEYIDRKSKEFVSEMDGDDEFFEDCEDDMDDIDDIDLKRVTSLMHMFMEEEKKGRN